MNTKYNVYRTVDLLLDIHVVHVYVMVVLTTHVQTNYLVYKIHKVITLGLV